MNDLLARVIGLNSTGAKLALLLSQLASDMGSAGTEARTVASEIRCLCTVLKALREMVERVQSSPYYSHCGEVVNDMTDASLEMYSDILKATTEVESMTKSHQDGKAKLMIWFQWAVFHNPKIRLLRASIEAYKSQLSLMLQTLHTVEKLSRGL